MITLDWTALFFSLAAGSTCHSLISVELFLVCLLFNVSGVSLECKTHEQKTLFVLFSTLILALRRVSDTKKEA